MKRVIAEVAPVPPYRNGDRAGDLTKPAQIQAPFAVNISGLPRLAVVVRSPCLHEAERPATSLCISSSDRGVQSYPHARHDVIVPAWRNLWPELGGSSTMQR